MCVASSQNQIHVYKLEPGFRFLYKFGGSKGLVVLKTPAMLCIPPWNGSCLLVVEAGGNRVQEVNFVLKTSVRLVLKDLSAPCGVAATMSHVAVTDDGGPGGAGRVTLLSRATGALKVFSVGDGLHHSFNGVRFCKGGDFILVADSAAHRVWKFDARTGAAVMHVGSQPQLDGPHDVEEVEGGVVVTSKYNNSVLRLSWLGGVSQITAPAPDTMHCPVALAVGTGGVLMVRDHHGPHDPRSDGRFRVIPMPAGD